MACSPDETRQFMTIQASDVWKQRCKMERTVLVTLNYYRFGFALEFHAVCEFDRQFRSSLFSARNVRTTLLRMRRIFRRTFRRRRLSHANTTTMNRSFPPVAKVTKRSLMFINIRLLSCHC